MIVVVDEAKVCLRDGHHRVLVAIELDLPYLPVKIERSEAIRKTNRTMAEFADHLWTLLGA